MSDEAGTGNETPQDKTFTQDEVNSFVASERKKHEEKMAGIAKERDDLAAFKNEADKFRADAEKSVADATLNATRFKVALDKGLPLPIAERLQGDDEASIAADADSLKALLPDPEKKPELRGPTGSGEPEKEPTMNDLIRKAANR